ncbi:hypothetical protein BGZ91_001836, partial [Linnemannia elongata]
MSKETHPTSLGLSPHDIQSTATLRSTTSQSSTDSAFSSIGRAANKAVQRSSTANNRSISHGLAAIVVGTLVPSDQASGDAGDDADNKSVSSQRVRKRDKIIDLFRSSSSKREAKQAQRSSLEAAVNRLSAGGTKATHHRLSTASTQYSGDIEDEISSIANNEHADSSSIDTTEHAVSGSVDIEHAVSSTEVKNPVSSAQASTLPTKSRVVVFSQNVNPPFVLIILPEFGSRIDTTSQLALCIGMLPKSSDPTDQEEDLSQVLSSETAAKHAWIKSMKQDPVEQERFRWLGTRMVDEFAKDASKDSTEIAEMVLIGPVLDNEHYRRLLSCTIAAFDQAVILD